jgi:hypothetical protein
MTKIDQTHITRSSTYRWVTAAFGLLFTAIAIGILIVSEFTLGSIIAAAITGFLGIEAIVSAYRKTSSLLSRIGPLP